MYWFRKKHNLFLYNKNIIELKSKIGMAYKKSKGVGRKNKSTSKIIDKAISELDEDFKIKIIKEYIEKINKSNDPKDKEILAKLIKEIELSSRKLSLSILYSKSHICRIRKGYKLLRVKTKKIIKLN